MVKDAPRIEADGHLSPEQEQELYRYYGMGGTQLAGTADMAGRREMAGRDEMAGMAGTGTDRLGDTGDAAGTVGHDVSGRTTDDAMDGPAISEEEHEVTLHAERPVVEKEAVPVERVRMNKDTVTDEEQVSAELRKEQIETDGVDERRS